MPRYTAILSKRARKALDKLSDRIAKPILTAIEALEENPRPHGYKKLVDRPGYRIRVSDYRVIYDIFDAELVVEIIEVGDRKDVYG